MKYLIVVLVCSLVVGCVADDPTKFSNGWDKDSLKAAWEEQDKEDRAERVKEYEAQLARERAYKDSILAVCVERGHIIQGLDTSCVYVVDYPDSTCMVRKYRATCQRCDYLTKVDDFNDEYAFYPAIHVNIIEDSIRHIKTLWRRND